jgi:hypothetical protein
MAGGRPVRRPNRRGQQTSQPTAGGSATWHAQVTPQDAAGHLDVCALGDEHVDVAEYRVCLDGDLGGSTPDPRVGGLDPRHQGARPARGQGPVG